MSQSAASPHELDESFGSLGLEDARPGFVGGAEMEAAAPAASPGGRAHPDDTAPRSDGDIPAEPLADRIRDTEGG